MTKNSRHFFFVAMFLFAQVGHTQQDQVVPPDYEIPATVDTSGLLRDLNLSQFAGKSFKRKIKVAVLDNGFIGRQKEIGNTLPADTTHDEGPLVEITDNEGKKVKVVPTEFHGSVMARLMMMVLRKSGALYDVDLHLFDALGYKRFSAAVEKIVEEKFDVVLYSQVWEYGGNGDGKGFINALVDKAVKSGAIWIQAAGNFTHMTRLNSVDGKLEGKDEWVVFTNSKGKTSKGVALTCDLPKPAPGMPPKKCPLRLTLGWNSYKDDTTTGTDKDLDLFVYDMNGKVVAKSDRNQVVAPDANDKNSALLPRELIENAQLDPGKYIARVKVKSKNFSASQDKVRLTLRPPFTMDEPSVGESLLPPADNPGVIVIGASDEAHSGVSKSLGLPKVLVRSIVKLKDGFAFAGSSSASAIAAGMTILFLGTGTEQSQAAVTTALKTVSSKRAPVPLEPTPKERPTPPPPTAPPQQQQPRAPKQGQTSSPPSYPPSQKPMPPQQQVQVQVQQTPPVPMPMPAPVPVAVPVVVPPPVPPQRYCLVARPLPIPYPAAQQLLMTGRAASVALGDGRAGILATYNFIAANQLRYPSPGEKVFITPRGPIVAAPQMLPGGIPNDFYEVILDRIPVCAVR